GLALEGSAGLVENAVEGEVELDTELIGLVVDELARALAAAAMVAEQRVGDGVEDGRFAAAVEAGEHPERGAVEQHFLLLAVAEEALETDALGNHASSFS